MKRSVLLFMAFVGLFCFAQPSPASNLDLVFLGVLGHETPAYENTFDKRIRDALSVNPEFRTADYLTSQELRRRAGTDDFPVVSRRMIESLRSFCSDSTIFVWVTIKSVTVKPVRVRLIQSDIIADATLTIDIYSMRYKDYTFIGDVHASSRIPAGFIFFYPVETGVHVSGADRELLMQKVADEAAFNANEMVTTIVKSEKAKIAAGIDTNEAAKMKAANISEMFRLPSVEGASVDNNKRKNTLPQVVKNPVPAKNDSIKTK